MITVEGLGGKGTLWCAVRFAHSVVVNDNSIDAYTSPNTYFASAPPFECYLPPTTGEKVWYRTDGSPYGPKVSKLEIGTLFGVNNSPDTPNPCEHSTINGALFISSKDPTKRPRYTIASTTLPENRKWYSPSGVPLTFAGGKSTTQAIAKAYNRYGVKVPINITTLTQMQWYYDTFLLTDWCDPVSSSTSTHVNGAKLGGLICSAVFNEDMLTPVLIHQYRCNHVSARVWKEVWIQEYHHNASYVPRQPVSPDTGYGYVVAYVKRTRVHTMVAIQAVYNGTFRCQIETVEDVEFWGHRGAWPIATFFSGIRKNTSTAILTLQVLEPGLSVGAEIVKGPMDNYCTLAKPRAIQLYEGKSAKTARSSAVADVSSLDSNWLENLSQIGGTTQVFIPLVMGWKSVRAGDLNGAKRALASAYLSYKYVIAPGIRDYHDLKNNLGTIYKGFTKYRFSNERRRGRLLKSVPVCEVSADLTYACTLNLQLKDSSIAQVLNALERLGLDPSAGNLWDLIPLSFVVDWFTGIGPALHSLDSMLNNVLLRNVKTRIESFKVQWPLTDVDLLALNLGDYSVTEPLKYTWYDRRILPGIGSFDPYAGQTLDGLSASQMTQGAALLTVFSKR